MSRAFIVASAMALTTLLPITTTAQTKNDGFFNSSNSNSDYTERASDFDYKILNQQFGQKDEPLGSGLLILAFAGAGYAMLKKKED